MPSNRRELLEQVRASAAQGIDLRPLARAAAAGHPDVRLRRRFPLPAFEWDMASHDPMLQRLMCQDAFELIEATQVAAALFINRHAQARANKPDGASAARRWQASTESRKLARQGLWDLQQARHAWLHGRPREAHLLVELARARIASITLAFALPLARQAAKQRTSQRTSRTAQQAARLARHIARLARSGMAPAEIAAELDVSTKTVTRHLRKSSGHT